MAYRFSVIPFSRLLPPFFIAWPPYLPEEEDEEEEEGTRVRGSLDEDVEEYEECDGAEEEEQRENLEEEEEEEEVARLGLSKTTETIQMSGIQ